MELITGRRLKIEGAGATNNGFFGNFFGVDDSGRNLGNPGDGIQIAGGASDKTIGAPGSGNTIAFCGGAGIAIIQGICNALLANAIYANVGLGIDLGDTGSVLADDSEDTDAGPNELQNYPVLSAVSISGSQTTVSGSLNSMPDTTFLLEFFGNAITTSTDTDGEVYLGSTYVTTDGQGNVSFTVTLNAAYGSYVTATATDPQDNTSEFSVFQPANPTAVADFYGTPENTELQVAAPGVMGNDFDPLSMTLTSSIVAGPSHGSATLASDGTLDYTPDTGFTGTDTLTYKITTSDGRTSDPATVTIDVSATPVANDDAFTVSEGQTLTVAASGVLANDTDPYGDPLNAVPMTAPANGTLTLNSDGSFTYTPDSGFTGVDSFTYQANDGTYSSNTATVTITVNPDPGPPVANDDSYSVNAGQTLIGSGSGVLSNDTDPAGSPLTAQLVSGPSNGTLTLDAGGSFTYMPNSGFTGTDTFTYQASDGTSTSNTATVTITVTANSSAPVAADDSYSGNAGQVISGSVLDNDSDADGDQLTAVLVSGPANGTLQLNSGGTFDYTPNAGFTGNDSFTYQATDGANSSNTATVTITVNTNTGVPVANNDSYSVNVGQTLTVTSSVLANDSDSDGEQLSAILVSSSVNGTLSFNDDGTFTYTPFPGFTGTDTFTYTASDGANVSNTATVSITVNANSGVPVASDDSYSVTAGQTLTASPDVLANDSDPDGDQLTAILVNGPSNGTLNFNSDGSFTYTPNFGFAGTDTFTYQASDGVNTSNPATVSITVNANSGVPVASDDSYSVTAGQTLTASPDVLANDSDPDGDQLTAILVNGPANGSLTFSSDGTFDYTPNAGFTGTATFTYQASDGANASNTATVTITVNANSTVPVANNDSYSVNAGQTLYVSPGVLANDTDSNGDQLTANLVSSPANGTVTFNADGTFLYAPNAGFTGSDTFTYQATDGVNTSAPATVTITVTANTGTPVASNDSYSISAGQTLSVDPGVLANDSDPDNDQLTAILVNGPANGSLTFNDDGTFDYTPNAGFTGTDTFTYQASDGTNISNTATVTITVTANSSVPVAHDDSYTVNVGQTLSASPSVLANDADPDGDQLTAILVSGAANGTVTLSLDGTFTYTPNAGFTGSDTFTYQATDGVNNSDTATVTITVTANNGVPVANNDSYSVNAGQTLPAGPSVLANDTDPDNDQLTALEVSGSANGSLTFNVDGTFSYTPNPGFTGTDTFTYQASDGTNTSNTATVTITVNGNSGMPVASDDSYSVNAGQVLYVNTGVLANDTDADGDTLSAILLGNPTNGGLTFNADGTFTYTPNAGFTGTDAFTYEASDGTNASNAATVTITVTANSSTPVATDDSYSFNAGQTLHVNPGVLTNDTDADGDTLSATLVSGPTNGTLSFYDDGTFSYTPNSGFSGTDTFTYQASDGANTSNTATVTITVNANTGAPVAADDRYSVNAGQTLIDYSGTLANDTDADGDQLTAFLVSGPTNGTLSFGSDGTFSYTPNAGFTGSDTFTYQASDGANTSNTATVTITVNPNNGVPVANDDGYSGNAGQTIYGSVLDNDSDPDGDLLTAVLVSGAANGTLNFNTDGTFDYTPNSGFSGQDTFTYQASDGVNESNTATVTLTVNPNNGVPVANDNNYSINAGQTLKVYAPGTLANDTDPDGDQLTAIQLTGTSNGSLSFYSDGSFTYTPNSGFTGTDSFTYQASDGTNSSNTATITITVNPNTGVPIANNDSYTATTGQTLTVAASGVLANDTDADGDQLTAVLVASTNNGTLTLNADGSFSYTPNAGFTGTDSFTYQASDGSSSSNTATATITVGQGTTTVTVTSSLNPSQYTQPVTFTVTITPSGGQGPAPSGQVDFYEDGFYLGSGMLSSGVATYTTSSLPTGNDTITAFYEGDSVYSGNSSDPLTQTVNENTTTVTLTSSLNPSQYTQDVTFTATVAPGAGSLSGTPSGQVDFYKDGFHLGSGMLSSGVATFDTSSLPTGDDTITAFYDGDSVYSGSSSDPLTQMVNENTTTVTLTSSLNPSPSGQPVTFTATVAPSGTSLSGTPSGQVGFYEDGSYLGSSTLSNGVATYTTDTLPIGDDTITATYEGDSVYSGNTSDPLTQTVQQGQNQLLDGPVVSPAPGVQPLTDAQLQPVLNAAITQWVSITGSTQTATQLHQATVRIVPLSGAVLGLTGTNIIWINATAAGYGWFVNATPRSNSAFMPTAGGPLVAGPGSPAYGHVDLYTVVAHELGHILGLGDVTPQGHTADLMAETLAPGERRVEGWGQVLDTSTSSAPISSAATASVFVPALQPVSAALAAALTPMVNSPAALAPNTLALLFAQDHPELASFAPLPSAALLESQALAALMPGAALEAPTLTAATGNSGGEVLIGGSGDSLVIGEPGAQVLLGGMAAEVSSGDVPVAS